MVTRQPNILFIQTDQLTTRVLNAYGMPVAKTPNLDDLAETGTVFANAYCNFPLCAPSRFSMAAGQLASRIGAYDNAAEFPASIPTYAHYLRELGYRTCLSGKMHFVGPDQLHGFERRLTTDIYPGDFDWSADWSASGYHGATDIRMLLDCGVCARSVQIDYDEDVTHKAVQEIYDCARDSETRPFFLQVSYTHPHDPYLCTQEYWDMYNGLDIPMPDVGQLEQNRHDAHSLRILKQHGLADADVSDEMVMTARQAYCGSVSYIDDNIGRLLHALKQSAQADNTVIVFCSDHGDMLGERGLWLKKNFFEPAVRVPLIISAPGLLQRGRVDTLCSLVDLLPTFAAIGSDGKWSDATEELDGSDLCELTVANGDTNRPIYGELLCEGITAPVFMIRRGAFKFVTSSADPAMLFDLDNDPDELHNLAGDASNRDMVQAFTAEASEKWDEATMTVDILKSQRRRRLIHRAHSRGIPPVWDHSVHDNDHARWFRGQGNYNDWAFDYLQAPGHAPRVPRGSRN